MKKQTQVIKIQSKRTHNRENSTPLYLTSSFCYEDAAQGKDLFDGTIEGNIYSRFSNPTVQEFIDKICVMEELEDGFSQDTPIWAIFGDLMSALVGVFVAKKGRSVRVAVTGAGSGGVFRHAAMEEALSKRFNAKALDGITTPAADMNGDIHASPEYRANLVVVMAKRAVAAAG
mgnify:CR=1 FL=1